MDDDGYTSTKNIVKHIRMVSLCQNSYKADIRRLLQNMVTKQGESLRDQNIEDSSNLLEI